MKLYRLDSGHKQSIPDERIYLATGVELLIYHVIKETDSFFITKNKKISKKAKKPYAYKTPQLAAMAFLENKKREQQYLLKRYNISTDDISAIYSSGMLNLNFDLEKVKFN